MRNPHRLFVLLFVSVLALGLSAFGLPGVAQAQVPSGPFPPFCEDLGYVFGVRFELTGSESYPATFTNGDFTVTITAPNAANTISFTSVQPVAAVLVKTAANGHNEYVYDPAVTSAGGLSPVLVGDSYRLKEIEFCLPAAPTPKDLFVTKSAVTSWGRTWTWTLVKSIQEATEDPAYISLDKGASITIHYDVVLGAQAQNSYSVTGEIWVQNPNESLSARVTSVTDTLSDGTVAEVTCPGGLPQDLPAGEMLVCTYAATLGSATDLENTATATTDGSNGVNGGSGSFPVDFADAPDSETDECVNFTDSLVSEANQAICASDLPLTITYPLTLKYDVCGTYEVPNVATITTNDTGTSTSDGANVTVDVPCTGGCSLTQGYWKTHSRKGPAPYDDNWQNVGPNQEDTLFFKSGQTWYQVFWTAPRGNVFYQLAHQYMAAKLNYYNGADTSVITAALSQAEGLFGAIPENSTSVPSASRATWSALATTLDQYNNGAIGPGHCEDESSASVVAPEQGDMQMVFLPAVTR